jgi:hypothetical protein
MNNETKKDLFELVLGLISIIAIGVTCYYLAIIFH